MTANEWKAIACALNNAKIHHEGDDQWRRCVEEIEKVCNELSRDFSRTPFRMYAGYFKVEP